MARRRALPIAAAPVPAKLTRPVAAGLVRRERLFRSLDAAARRRAVWISAPGGSGKTSLVTTWVETRGINALWYRLDAGDGDPGTLFHWLRGAARVRAEGDALPAFAPENMEALELYARQFFEAWFMRIDEALTLVFDNFEQVPAESRAGEVLAGLLAVLPERARLIVVSRSRPPAALARWEASPELACLDWDELRFSREEAAALAAQWGVVDADVVAPLADSSRGWAAGIVLMLRAARAGITVRDNGDAAPRGLFNYFAQEIHAQLPAATQQFLLRSAFLRDITVPMAEVLTGEPGAARILVALHADNFFIERKQQVVPGTPVQYEYHPLFRDFLRDCAQQRLGAAELADLRRRAAALLEAAGQVQAAAELLIDAGDSVRLAALAEAHAPTLVDSARFGTLQGWLERLPGGAMERHPRLLLWAGLCKLAARAADWPAAMERARMALEAAHDLAGAFAARLRRLPVVADPADAEADVEAMLAFVEDRWDTLEPAEQRELLSHFRLDLRTPLMLKLVRALRDRVEPVFMAARDPDTQMALGPFLANAASSHGDVERQRVLAPLLAPLIEAGHGSLLARADSLAYLSFYWNQCGSCDDNRRALRGLDALGDVGGFYVDQVLVWQSALRCALLARDDAAAARLEPRVRAIARLVPWRFMLFLPSAVHLYLRTGQLHLAAEAADELHRLVPERSPIRSLVGVARGQVLLVDGRPAEALAALAEGLAAARQWGHRTVLFSNLVLMTVAHRRSADLDAADRSLTEALALSRASGIVRGNQIFDPLYTEALVHALTRGIEVEQARHIIAMSEQPSPDIEVGGWPWPRRLMLFGGATLVGSVADGPAGDSPAHGKRAARRTLELLAFVAVRGGGMPVAASAAIDALWPDAEGDAAKKSFEITLHRLRRQLGSDAAIRLEGGKLHLDVTRCWVDALAFAQMTERVESGQGSGADVEHALALYRGPLFGDDPPAWGVPWRERLQARYARLVEQAGRAYVAAGQSAEARRCLTHAMETDASVERTCTRLLHAWDTE